MLAKSVSVVLNLFSASTRVCLEAVKAISLLCQYSDDMSSYHSGNCEELGGHGTCFPVIRILTSSNHITNDELIEETCRAIGKLSLSENNNKVMASGGCCESLLSLVKNPEISASVTVQAAYALRMLSELNETMNHLMSNGVCEAVISALSRCRQEDQEANCIELIGTIIALGSTSTVACKGLGEAGGCMAVLQCVKDNELSSEVFAKALIAMEMFLTAEENLPRLLKASICDILVTSLQMHAAHEVVAVNACRVIQLFATNPIIRSKLSSAGACEIMRRLFSVHMASPSVMQACCAAVATLASGHVENKNQLTAAGVCEFIIMTMQKYSIGEAKLLGNVLPKGSELVVWQASWALRILATEGDNTTRLEEASICEAINAALQRHASSADSVIQLLRLVVVLSEDEKHSIVSHMGTAGLCKSIVKAIHKCQSHAVVCDLALKPSTTSELITPTLPCSPPPRLLRKYPESLWCIPPMICI